MRAALIAALVYFVVVFATAFALGVLRVLVIAPRFGDARAVLTEVPLIVGLSWFTCRWLTYRHGVARLLGPRAIMGGAAFLLLVAAEFALAAALGEPVGTYLATLATPAGAIGLAGQLTYAMMPMMQIKVR